MINLPLPAYTSAETDLKKAVKTYKYKQEIKGHNITKKETCDMLDLYKLYDANFAEPKNELKGENFTKKFLASIFAAYSLTQATRKLNHIRKLVFSTIAYCPICGITKPTHLDHHLPISQFKPLSIYPNNLVPLCKDCNEIKKAVVEEDPSTRFIHLYFDKIPNIEFFDAKIEIDQGGLIVEFHVKNVFDKTNHLHTRLSNQIHKLKLNERYTPEINKCMNGHAVSLHGAFLSGGKSSVKLYLKIQANHAKTAYHQNHWNPTLLRALSECDAFCDNGFRTLYPVAQEIIDDMYKLSQPHT